MNIIRSIDSSQNEDKNQIEKEEYSLVKDNKLYKITITRKEEQIILKYFNYEIKLTPENCSLLLNKKFNTINQSYDYFIKKFIRKKILIKEFYPNKFLSLQMTKFDKNNHKEKEIEIKLEFQAKINPENITFFSDLSIDSYSLFFIDNTFITFNSVNNIIYLIYSTKNKSIISYNLNENQKDAEILYAHEDLITNFRHYFEQQKKKDLILSISGRNNNVKIWNISNWECLYNIRNKISIKDNYLYSACFINDFNNSYLIFNYRQFVGEPESIKIYDFQGTAIKEINQSKDNTWFIDTFYDEKSFIHYIITGNSNCVKSYDYDKNQFYHVYQDGNNDIHFSIIITYSEGIIKLIESCLDGYIRIWNFHNCELLFKIKGAQKGLRSIVLWDDNYLFAGCGDNDIKLIELENRNIVKSLSGHNNSISTIKKIVHPKYGECLISQGGRDDKHIKLWIDKKFF